MAKLRKRRKLHKGGNSPISKCWHRLPETIRAAAEQKRISGVGRDSSLFTKIVQLFYKVPLHSICALLYKISNYSLPWCSFCRFPFACRAIFGICICGNTRFPFIYSTWATFWCFGGNFDEKVVMC